MLAASLAGALSFFRLGRAEDPPFTIRTMVVSAAWPGATMDETMQQITERLERTLEETPHLDFLRSFTRPGVTTIFVNLLGATNAKQVDDTWYHVRKSIGDMRHTLPAGVVGPFFDDEFGDTFGIIYGLTSDGFTHRELRDYAEDIRGRLLSVPDVESDRDPGRPGRDHLHRVLHQAAGRARHRPVGLRGGAPGAERGPADGRHPDRQREPGAAGDGRPSIRNPTCATSRSR